MVDEPTGTTNARLSRLEAKYDDLAKQVEGAVHTIARVEQNQTHAEELNKLRFSSLDTAVGGLSMDLKGFMARIDGIMSGEVQTQQTRQSAELVADYQAWRKEVDADRDQQAVLNGQMKLLGRIAILLTIGGGITTLCSVVALAVTLSHP